MEDNTRNNEANTDLITPQGTISNARKIMIIDFMFRRSENATFLGNREGIKSFPLVTAEEKDFADEVYEIIKGLNIGEDVFRITNRQELIEQVYSKCNISKEAVEMIKQERIAKIQKSMDKIQQERDIVDAKIAVKNGNTAGIVEQQITNLKVVEGIEGSKSVGYKEDLYNPGILCGHSEEMPGKPFVEHVSYTSERIANISPQTSYQFADRVYTIRQSGELFYMATPNSKESIYEYEITISRDDISRTIRVFGEISFNKMSDAAYSAVVFLGLLGVTNLTDKELHGYIGSLEQVRDKNGEAKNQYRMVYSPEEYTAVAIWEQIEKAKEQRKDQSKLGKDEGKVAGGEDR